MDISRAAARMAEDLLGDRAVAERLLVRAERIADDEIESRTYIPTEKVLKTRDQMVQEQYLHLVDVVAQAHEELVVGAGGRGLDDATGLGLSHLAHDCAKRVGLEGALVARRYVAALADATGQRTVPRLAAGICVVLRGPEPIDEFETVLGNAIGVMFEALDPRASGYGDHARRIRARLNKRFAHFASKRGPRLAPAVGDLDLEAEARYALELVVPWWTRCPVAESVDEIPDAERREIPYRDLFHRVLHRTRDDHAGDVVHPGGPERFFQRYPELPPALYRRFPRLCEQGPGGVYPSKESREQMQVFHALLCPACFREIAVDLLDRENRATLTEEQLALALAPVDFPAFLTGRTSSRSVPT